MHVTECQAEYIALCVLLRRIRHQPKVLLCRKRGDQHWCFPMSVFVPKRSESPRTVFDRQMLEIFSLDSRRLTTSTLTPPFQSEGRSVRVVMHLTDKEYAQIGDAAPVSTRWALIDDIRSCKIRIDGASARVLGWLQEKEQEHYWFRE